MKTTLILISLMLTLDASAQHNFLGNCQEYIVDYYNFDPEYSVKIDTISELTILITVKSFDQYPYFTYEIDRINDICISYAYISKNREVLNNYIDILDHLGELVECDSAFNNFTYKVVRPNVTTYYTIKQPFINSTYYSRRSIFYILVSDDITESNEK